MLENKLPTEIAPDSRPRARPEDSAEVLTLTPERIETFLNVLQERGRTPETVQTYRIKLYLLYDWLPEEKQIARGTLEEWRESLLNEGYAVRTVNLCISAANSLLEACGRRNLQIGKPLEPKGDIQPELTRNEYLRLLSTARTLGKEREYLMVKVFAATGINIKELSRLTVEAAQAGKMTLPQHGSAYPGVSAGGAAGLCQAEWYRLWACVRDQDTRALFPHRCNGPDPAAVL